MGLTENREKGGSNKTGEKGGDGERIFLKLLTKNPGAQEEAKKTNTEGKGGGEGGGK